MVRPKLLVFLLETLIDASLEPDKQTVAWDATVNFPNTCHLRVRANETFSPYSGVGKLAVLTGSANSRPFSRPNGSGGCDAVVTFTWGFRITPSEIILSPIKVVQPSAFQAHAVGEAHQ
jgi:hypothetical protein